MGIAQGYGRTAGGDSLVFAYDTGDTRNSYIGEPTTNLITHVLPNSNWNTNGSGVIITQNYGYDHNGVLRSSKIMDNPNSGNGSFAYTSAFSVSAGTYTFSAMVKTSSTNASSNSSMVLYNMNPITNLGGTSFNSITPEVWTKVSVTGTLASGTTHIAPHFYSLSGDGTNFIEVVDVQLEQKSHATPFAGPLGTRSSTQGLVDLTGNSTIDLANVSFDSNAQIVFDGTDDVITVPMDNLRPTSAITQEVVVYIDNNTTQVWIGSQYGTSSGNSYALWLNGANTLAAGVNIGGSFNYQSQSYPITLNTYYHFVHTYDGTTQRIYANGVEIRQWTTTGNIEYNINNTLLAIGNDWNGSGYNTGASLATHGKQDITKIYNRALTEDEIRNNYRHYKTRFNI